MSTREWAVEVVHAEHYNLSTYVHADNYLAAHQAVLNLNKVFPDDILHMEITSQDEEDNDDEDEEEDDDS